MESRRRKLVEAILAGVPGGMVKDELNALGDRREELERLTQTIADVPPLLHPSMATEWNTQISQLREALAEDEANPVAREAVRALIEEIRLTPQNGLLAIDVKGDLAEMLGAASPSDDWQRQVTLVAGAGFDLLPLGFEPTIVGSDSSLPFTSRTSEIRLAAVT